MKLVKYFSALIIAVILTFALPFQPAYGQGGNDSRVDICRGVTAQDQSTCQACSNSGGVWTGLGCLPTDPETFVASWLRFSIGLAAGVAFLRMVYGAFKITVASGNPEGVQDGKDTIASSIYGLLFIIFSAVVLNLIGVEILAIPGF
jgi:hypothetical protein